MKKRQPVRGGLVEGLQDARVVGLSAAPLQQRFALLAAIPSEVFVQQVDHGPKVTALFDIDLKEVAQIVLAGCGQPKVSLLLDGGRLGIALGHDNAPQIGPILAGDILPGILTDVIAKMDLPTLFGRVQKDAPTVVGHLDVSELGPALGIDAGGCPEIDIEILAAVRPHVLPPGQVVGLPLLERTLQRAVFAQVDVVGDLVAVIDR